MEEKAFIDRLVRFAGFCHEKNDMGLVDAALDDKWTALTANEPKKLFDAQGNLILKNLRSFRRLNIFVSDMYPGTVFSDYQPQRWLREFTTRPLGALVDILKELIYGYYRGSRILLRDIHAVLEKEKALGVLERNPVRDTPGEPYNFNYQGGSYNLRWARHIYFNNLLNKHLGPEIDARERFISLDIGASFGAFSSVFKREHPNTTQIVLDFPDQLILSFYFLGTLFPGARLGTLMELPAEGMIDRATLAQYDFVFLPVAAYKRLQPGAVDMVTNFFSFGEMRREWFEAYIKSELFEQAEFFFTSNRFESSPFHDPTYDSDLTVFDYPLGDFERVYYCVSPIYPYLVKRHGLFSYHRFCQSSQYFDFIGRRRAAG